MILQRGGALAAPLFFVAALSVLFVGCGGIEDYGVLVRANRLHLRGLYQDAAADYLSVKTPAFLPTVDYDLANVYARLGEYGAAAELYARAREEGDRGIKADSFYNEGAILFEKGRYEESWRAFRAAIVQASSSMGGGSAEFLGDARHNLELAWKAWKKRAAAPPQTAAPSGRSENPEDETELRLLERLETGRWKPGGAQSAAAGPDDY